MPPTYPRPCLPVPGVAWQRSHQGDPTLSKGPVHILSQDLPSGSALTHLCLFVTVLNQILLDLLSLQALEEAAQWELSPRCS